MIRVLIATNHVVVCYGLQAILEEVSDIQIIGEATTATEILPQIQRASCRLLLLDSSLLDETGLHLLTNLKHSAPSLQILLFSLQLNQKLGLRGLKAGASGYLMSNCPPNDIIKAVQMVAKGRKYICQEIAEALMMDAETGSDKRSHHYLSNREFQVVRLIGAGKTLTQTAETLGLSKTTISTYRTRILEKLKLSSNAEIMRYALEPGLVC